MSSFSVIIDDKQLTAYLNKNIAKIKPQLIQTMNTSAAQGIRIAVENTPKRSGNARRAWKAKKTGEFTRELSTETATKAINIVINTLENGRKARPNVVPKKKNGLLVFAIKDSALTSTKAQLKKSAVDKFFKIASKEGFEKATAATGVVAARKVNQPARAGTHFIKRNILPKVERLLNEQLSQMVKGL